ncbi:unnamed protein product, partial [Ectocarpus fasciculatus]
RVSTCKGEKGSFPPLLLLPTCKEYTLVYTQSRLLVQTINCVLCAPRYHGTEFQRRAPTPEREKDTQQLGCPSASIVLVSLGFHVIAFKSLNSPFVFALWFANVTTHGGL